MSSISKPEKKNKENGQILDLGQQYKLKVENSNDMVMERLSTENFREVAMNHYGRGGRKVFVISEFDEDLKIFQTVGRALDRYVKTGTIELRLILNNIIILHNVFGNFAVDGLFFKTPEVAWVSLSSILKFLGLLPEWFIQFRFQGDSDLEKELEKL